MAKKAVVTSIVHITHVDKAEAHHENKAGPEGSFTVSGLAVVMEKQLINPQEGRSLWWISICL